MVHHIRRILILVTVLVAGICLVPGFISAHSILIESTPKHGATLTAAPQNVLLRFNAKIEPGLTKVSLVNGRNHRTPLEILGESTVDRILARMPRLEPGVYTVVYKVLATDGHITQGSIRFTLLAS